MQGKGFILKRVYLERNQEREYKSHIKRLEQINRKAPDISKKIKPIDKEIEKSNRNHMKSAQFREIEKLRQEKVTNKALIDKLVEINDGKYSVARRTMKSSSSQAQMKSSTGLNGTKSQKSVWMGSLNTVGRRLEEERIARENHSLAQRMINLPPVIQKSRQDKDYKKNRELKERILRFHVLKEKPEKQYERQNFDPHAEDDDDDEYDPEDEELMNKKVQMVIGLKDIKFINFLPSNDDSEKYSLEIKASVRGMRTTIPENYEDFSQSVINEFFYLKELKKSKLVYIALNQIKNDKKIFLGDFELDLAPYFEESCFHDIHYDLRNYKELRTMPNYMHKDMRKKGNIDFYLQITSDIKTFNIQRKVDREANQEAQRQLDDQQKQQQQQNNNQQQQQPEQQETIPVVAENHSK